MDVLRTAVDNFHTGNGVATETPTPIVAEGYPPQTVCKGVFIRCLTGTIYVSAEGTAPGEGFTLAAGADVTVPVNAPSKIFVDGDGTYAWVAS